MKKIYITLAVLSLAAIMNTACDNREEEIGGDTELSSDVIAFSLKGISTRAEVSSIETSDEVNIIPLGTDDQNNNFFLEESVIDLEAPVTRGTPVYTSNAMKVHGNAIATYAPAIQNDVFNVEYDETKDVFMKAFGREIWPAGTEQNPSSLEFYMNWPVNPTGVNISSRNGGKITFTYESPATAANQQDILFTYRNISKADYDNNGGKADILFHHALTGVKFASGNKSTDAVVIKEVVFTGLHDNGNCTVTPIAEDGKYVDDPSDYSSATAVVWDNTKNTTGKTISSGEYSSTLVDFTGTSFTTKGDFPTSFTAAGNKNNLNDGDATQTFWLIPQAMTNDIKLKIVYTVNGTEGEWTIDFGKVLAEKNVVWKAGQLRTYTIKLDYLDLDITDEVIGFEKTNVNITNTGNIEAYVRAYITANWFGYNGINNGVALGYKSATSDEFVDAWKLNNELTGDNYGGVFTGLPGTDWVYKDGFFYYTEKVPAGQDTGSKLFTKYVLDTTPADVPPVIYYLDHKGGRMPFTNIRLVMEIPVQAVDARDFTDYKEAWRNAGVSIE